MSNKPKTLYFCVFGCRAYVFLPTEVYTNKLILHSKLIIFIGYEDNSYCFMYYIQRNIIFHFTYAIFDKGLFKYTNSHAKEYKLYDKLLDKISLETELLVPDLSRKDEPVLVSILHIFIPSIQNNSPTCSSLSFLFYKFIFPLPISGSKKLTVEIEEKNNDVDSDVEMQLLSPQ